MADAFPSACLMSEVLVDAGFGERRPFINPRSFYWTSSQAERTCRYIRGEAAMTPRVGKLSIPDQHSLEELVADRRREERAAVRSFVEAIKTANAESLGAAIDAVDKQSAWDAAMRAIVNVPCPSADFRHRLLNLWLRSGDHLRGEVNDDLVLAKALRSILPPYDGPPLTLYRADSARNRSRRTYGLAWSASKDVARGFAVDLWRASQGGSVLLETQAPAASIICAPALINDCYGEQEYLVDRKFLCSVKVIERFSQVPL
jgi:hypothetical protein